MAGRKTRNTSQHVPARARQAKPAHRQKQPVLAAISDYNAVLNDVSTVLASARRGTARAINAFMTAAYWQIGRRIVEWEQGGRERLKYGDDLLHRLSADLTGQFGRGFSWRNLYQMRQFYLAYPLSDPDSPPPAGEMIASGKPPDILQTPSAKSGPTPPRSSAARRPARILQTLSAKLHPAKTLENKTFSNTTAAPSRFADNSIDRSIARFNATNHEPFPLPWSHYVQLLSVQSDEGRRFYEAEALRGGWTVRQSERQINSMFYERTALSRDKARLLRASGRIKPGDTLTPEEELRDPCVLDFLDMKDCYSERELESALVEKVQSFILELGNDFAFIDRQRKLRIGHSWYKVDLLLYHRRLRCVVVIDLKLGRFTHADMGQMHLYLGYAREHWTAEGENPPVGLILCAQKDDAVARYSLDTLPNKVITAEYRLALPDEKALVNEINRTRAELARYKKRNPAPKT